MILLSQLEGGLRECGGGTGTLVVAGSRCWVALVGSQTPLHMAPSHLKYSLDEQTGERAIIVIIHFLLVEHAISVLVQLDIMTVNLCCCCGCKPIPKALFILQKVFYCTVYCDIYVKYIMSHQYYLILSNLHPFPQCVLASSCAPAAPALAIIRVPGPIWHASTMAPSAFCGSRCVK